jgi:hypothetical protein
MLRASLAATLIALASSPAISADWPQADVDKAIAVVDTNEYLTECVRSAGTEIEFLVDQKDLNKDGVNELIVHSHSKELGNGSSVCFGRAGSEIHLLISDGAGGWKHQFGFDMSELEYHKSETEWPDIEFVGPGFCFPIWRYHEGSYGMWKVCDDNDKLIYADAAPWIKEGAVPSGVQKTASASGKLPAGQPEAPIHTDDLSGPEFMHNGSVMAVDHERGLIIYSDPKASLSDVVRAGDVLFQADKPWDMYVIGEKISGTAFVFKKGCKPVGYRVEGGVGQSWHTVELRGEAPVRKKGSCDIAGLTKKGSNANLKFESVID